MPQWALIVLGALFWPVFIGGGVLIWRLLQKKRTEGMKAAASELGLQFSTATDDALLGRLLRIPVFGPGEHHKIRVQKMKNAMTTCEDSTILTVLDYLYAVRDASDTTRFNHTVLVMEAESLRLPAFTLRPEGMADRISAALGAQDIDFDSHPEFSKLYVLEGPDEEAIRSMFDWELLDGLVGLAMPKETIVAGSPGMLVYFDGSLKKPTEIGDFIEEGRAALALFARRMSR